MAVTVTPSVSTLSSGTKRVPVMPVSREAILCPAPVLMSEFDACQIPGGLDLWWSDGFYSPGVCFVGYRASCTQTSESGWPIQPGETAVRCIPEGYECNDQTKDQRYAVSDFDGTILSAPAFEIRWQEKDLKSGDGHWQPHAPTLPPISGSPTRPSSRSTSSGPSPASGVATVSPTWSEQPSGARSPLSPSSVAGIAVGSCLGVVAAGSVAVLLLVRHRRKRLEASARIPDDEVDEVDGQAVSVPVEMEDKPMEPKELSAETKTKIGIPAKSVDDGDGGSTAFVLRVPHISVNSTPAEVAAEPVSAALAAEMEGS